MTKNKLILMLLSLVSAFLLWLYVITFISPESEETITGIAVIDPAETERVLDARGLMLLQEEPITVTLTLEGNRTDLVKLNSSNLKIKVDYSNINNEGDQMEPNVEIFWPEGTVGSDYIVKSMNPSPITVKVVKKAKDTPITVKVVEQDLIPDGYKVIDWGCPETVKVTGPADVVASIAYAQVNVRYNGQVQGLDGKYDVVLYDAKGNPVDTKWLSPVQPVVLVPEIHRQKTIELGVDVTDGAGATKDTTELKFSPAAIVVTCPEEVMAEVDKCLVDGKLILDNLDLAKYLKDEKEEYDIWDLGLPMEDVAITDLNGNAFDTATLSIKFPALEKVDMTVTGFEVKNVPVGYQAKLPNEAEGVSVTIRGPKDLMKQLKVENVKLVLDLSEAVVGENIVQAKVVIMDNSITTAASTKAGYDVLVVLEEADEKETAKKTEE